jgi:tetrahydromethanopterin S-methyltransferase subunit G
LDSSLDSIKKAHSSYKYEYQSLEYYGQAAHHQVENDFAAMCRQQEVGKLIGRDTGRLWAVVPPIHLLDRPVDLVASKKLVNESAHALLRVRLLLYRMPPTN